MTEATTIKENDATTMMKRYPRLVAHMICQSLGYFTPFRAAQAVAYYKDNKPYFCEMYSHSVHLRSKHLTGKENDFFNRDIIMDVQKDFIDYSFKSRHNHKGYMSDYITARKLIVKELEGKGPEFASWF